MKTTDIITVSDNVEVHPAAKGGFAVVVTGGVFATFATEREALRVARQIAQDRGEESRE